MREHSNPAGVVGLASAMHCTFEAATFHGNKLESLEDFIKEMRSQYQTSLGFGTSFSKDAFPGTRRRRSGRGRGFWRNKRFAQQGVMRVQVASQGTSTGGQCFFFPRDTFRFARDIFRKSARDFVKVPVTKNPEFCP